MKLKLRSMARAMAIATALSWSALAYGESNDVVQSKTVVQTSKPQGVTAQRARCEKRKEARARLEQILKDPPNTAPPSVQRARAKQLNAERARRVP